MKITAKLAYSQLKINQSRTLWTILAIVLSTSLTMAICSIIASGNEMIVHFLGEDYGDYGGAYLLLMLIPAIILGFLIFAMSVTVISNVFRISAQERVNQFGIMKCTGATQRQITETVMYESIWLCIIGIPLGIVSGQLLAFGAICVINHYTNELQELAHMMMREITLSMKFVFSVPATLISVLLCILTVLYSAWRPAHRAAKISAIECIRPNATTNIAKKQLRENQLVKRIFGFEGTLADKNLKRNHGNFRATLISLSVGVILFVSLGGLEKQASAIQDILSLNIDETVIAGYACGRDEGVNEKTGRRETIYLRPIDSQLGEQVTKRLEEYEDIDIFGMGNNRDIYFTVLSAEQVTYQMQQIYESPEESSEPEGFEYDVELVTLDQENYEKLCEQANVPVGSTILLNQYSYNDFGNEVKLEPFTSAIHNMELRKADGSITNVPIQGTLTAEQMPKELFYVNTNPIRLLVAEASVGEYTWYAAPEDIDAFMKYSNQVLTEEFPSHTQNSYDQEGFNTRVYKTDEYMQVMNIAISLVAVFMYSFVVLLVLIGLTNVISTLSANVMMRAREFAVLKSVGMTPESMRRMLHYESILCSAKALIYGIPIGVIITILINLPIRSLLPIPYELPLAAIIICALVVFILTLAVTRYAAHKLRKQNIIEAIRAESGR